MKNFTSILAAIVCLLVSATALSAQAPDKPYILEVRIDDIPVDHSKGIEITKESEVEIRFSARPNSQGLTYSVKKMAFYFLTGTGASRNLASQKVQNDGNGMNTVRIGYSSPPGKVQCTLEGITMHKNGKKKTANIPIGDRTIMVTSLASFQK